MEKSLKEQVEHLIDVCANELEDDLKLVVEYLQYRYADDAYCMQIDDTAYSAIRRAFRRAILNGMDIQEKFGK